ncbi:MAG: DNA topoisomerase, partial [Actinobacteria bacterium]|nr:DNA topoisomerase [Actinomycetota bacterium]
MKLIVTEKNIAAQKLAEILATGKPKADKVYSTPVYRFTRDGEDWVTIGLKGHILGVDFPDTLVYKKGTGWRGVDSEGEVIPASIPDSVDKPPFTKRRPFTADGVDLKQWALPALPYLVYAPLIKTPAEKEIIRSLKNLSTKADDIVIATDFDREGELIGFDAQSLIRAVNKDVPITRARYSAITKEEIARAFSDLTAVDENLAQAGESRQFIDLIWGAALTRYLTIVKRTGFGSVRSAGRVQTPTLALVAARERERMAFKPEDYWVIKGNFKHETDTFTANHAKDRFKDEAEALRVMAQLDGRTEGRIDTIVKKSRQVSAPTPFNTTSLQAAAAAEGISPARTMRIAETLYMNGFTSYPRVDNTVYPASLDLKATLAMLKGVPAYEPFVSKLLAKKELKPTRGKMETTDHPPIYPTGVGNPDSMKPEEWKLYNLIARRFM